MRSWASLAVKAADVGGRAHHPQQQIDVVDRLVHERPAAVERLGPLPAAFVVVGLERHHLHVVSPSVIRPKRPWSTACLQGLARIADNATERWCRAGRYAGTGVIMRSQRSSVISNGFSTTTCLPASAAATAGSR